ncbi:unnamed protein product, partial [Ectocarpus fasciculatus]
DPRLSRYYGVSMVEGCGALRFALEGRPLDWSRLDGDGCGSRSLQAGRRWTYVAPEKDGCRTFASCGRGANVEVKITKPSYAQVCEVAGIWVNGVDCTSFAAFKPALDVGSFSNPEGLSKVLAAVSSVSLCEGFREHRKQDVVVTASPATPAPVAGMADSSSLNRQAGGTVGCNSSSSPRAVGEGTNEGPLVSAKLGVAGGNTVLWSRKCSRVLPARVVAEAMGSPKKQQVEGAARRCSECSEPLLSGSLPRVRERAGGAGGAGGAAAGGIGGVAGGGCCSEEGQEVAATADKEDKLHGIHDSEEGPERRSHPTVGSIRTQPSPPAPRLDEQRREGSYQTVGAVLKRDVASTGGVDQATEDVGFAKPDSTGTRKTSSLRAEEGSARKRFKKRACSAESLKNSSTSKRHYPGRDGEVMVAALGLSTLRTIPRHRQVGWALTSSGPGDNMGC